MTRSPAIYIGKDEKDNVTFISLWHIVKGRWVNIVQQLDYETGEVYYYTDGQRENHYSSKISKGN